MREDAMTPRQIAGLRAFALVAALGAAAAVSAQTAPPVRVRGTIDKAESQSLTVKAREGNTVEIRLVENVAVLGVTKAGLADISVGKFVGAAALPQPDGSLKALEVLIFPEAARGTGEGHYAWDLLPESTMTNATVAETVAGVSGPTLTLKYKDGEKKIVVPPEAPIVTFSPADRSLLKPGAAVFVPTQRQGDGSLTASRVLVGRDGLVPPM
jgi:hypothetical protein